MVDSSPRAAHEPPPAAGVGRLGAVFGPWLGGILVAGGLSALGFGVFALAGLLGAVMVSLVRRLPKPVALPRSTQRA